MKMDTKRFTQIMPNIETVPFSETESCTILKMTHTQLIRAIKTRLIEKSVDIHYRFDISLSFFSLYDMYVYALRREFFFLNYGFHPEINELVYSIVDEMAFVIDDCLCTNSQPRLNHVYKDIKTLCNEDRKKWREYWLYEGEQFSAAKCSTMAVNIWCKIYNNVTKIIGPIETACEHNQIKRYPQNTSMP